MPEIADNFIKLARCYRRMTKFGSTAAAILGFITAAIGGFNSCQLNNLEKSQRQFTLKNECATPLNIDKMDAVKFLEPVILKSYKCIWIKKDQKNTCDDAISGLQEWQYTYASKLKSIPERGKCKESLKLAINHLFSSIEKITIMSSHTSDDEKISDIEEIQAALDEVNANNIHTVCCEE